MTDAKIARIEKAIGYAFRDKDLLVAAFTHASVPGAQTENSDNDRLEFLGDAVLGLIVAERLYLETDLRSGEMTKKRALRVSNEAEADAADRLGISDFLERDANTPVSEKMKASLFEALVAAIFLDCGCDDKIVNMFVDAYLTADSGPDYKSALQEYCQRDGMNRKPEYSVPEEKDGVFSVSVAVEGRTFYGKGRKKALAEQAAAKEALRELGLLC